MISFYQSLDHESEWVEHVCFNAAESLMAACSSTEVYIWTTKGYPDGGHGSDVLMITEGKDQRKGDQTEAEGAEARNEKSITPDKDEERTEKYTLGSLDSGQGREMANPTSFTLLAKLPHEDVVWKSQFFEETKIPLLCTACSDGFVYIWDINEFGEEKEMCPRKICVYPKKRTFSFAVLGGNLFAGDFEGKLHVFDILIGDVLLLNFKAHNDVIEDVCASSTAQRIATCSKDKTTCLWSWNPRCKSLEKIHHLKGHKHWIFQVNFSRDGHFLSTASADKNVDVWCVKSGKLLQVLVGHSNIVWSAVFIEQREISRDSSPDVKGVQLKRQASQEHRTDCITSSSGNVQSLGVLCLRALKALSLLDPLISNSHTPFTLISGKAQQIMGKIDTEATSGSKRLKAISDIKISEGRSGCGCLCPEERIGHDTSNVSLLQDCLLVSCSSDSSVRLWKLSEAQNPLLEAHRNLGGSRTGKEQLFSCAYAAKLGILAVASYHGEVYIASVSVHSDKPNIHEN